MQSRHASGFFSPSVCFCVSEVCEGCVCVSVCVFQCVPNLWRLLRVKTEGLNLFCVMRGDGSELLFWWSLFLIDWSVCSHFSHEWTYVASSPQWSFFTLYIIKLVHVFSCFWSSAKIQTISYYIETAWQCRINCSRFTLHSKFILYIWDLS